MKSKKKVVIIVVAIVLVIALIGCAFLFLKKDAFGMNRSERNAAAITVGGTEKVTAGELATYFNNYYSNLNQQYSYYGFTFPEDDVKESVVEELAEEKAYVCIARELGLSLTAEEEAECKTSGKEAYQELLDEYTEYYESNGTTDAANYALTSVTDYLANYGYGTKQAFIDRNTEAARDEKLMSKVEEYYKNEAGYTDEQLPELYEKFVTENYKDTYYDGVVATYDEYYAEDYQVIRYLYIPEDFLFVRVISLTDEARASEIFADIAGDAEKFETYCKSDENTDVLMKKIADDDAYAIGANDSSFDAAVYEKAAAMNIGDIELVNVVTGTDDDGNETGTCYIIRRVEGTTGIVPFEKVKDTVSSDVLEYVQSEYIEEKVHAWLNTEGNVVKNEEVIAKIKAVS